VKQFYKLPEKEQEKERLSKELDNFNFYCQDEENISQLLLIRN